MNQWSHPPLQQSKKLVNNTSSHTKPTWWWKICCQTANKVGSQATWNFSPHCTAKTTFIWTQNGTRTRGSVQQFHEVIQRTWSQGYSKFPKGEETCYCLPILQSSRKLVAQQRSDYYGIQWLISFKSRTTPLRCNQRLHSEYKTKGASHYSINIWSSRTAQFSSHCI